MKWNAQSWLGRTAPSLRLRMRGGAVTLESFERQPIVLAFLDGWSKEESSELVLDQLRAELRGLAAVLVVVSSSGLFSFRADDDVERHASGDELDVEDVARARHAFELGARSALFVVDGDHIVRFAHAWPESELVDLDVVTSALSVAGREMLRASSSPALVSRRELVTTSLVAAFAVAFLDACTKPESTALDGGAPAASASLRAGAAPPGAGEVDVTLNVNGTPTKVRIDPRTTLLDALRERMSLTGTKKGCDHGQCGACTVHVDGRRVKSCMLFALMVEGKAITTIEGLAQGDTLHPMQEAFISEDGLQCGYCTPGQIMSAVALLAEGRAKTDAEVREQMSGNICRCGAYTNIVHAIQLARKRA